MQIIRIDAAFDRYKELLALILDAFAYMDGRIDPPSSAHALTIEGLSEKASAEIGFVAVDGSVLAGCIFCKPETDCLYIGKLAVSATCRGKGVGRLLLASAEAAARDRHLAALRLLTRIELTENHRTFSAWGFVETDRTAHPGFTRPTSIEMRKTL
ncbi:MULTISPECIES: GNAT family N-acetyltransferase [Ensifer]|jgi:GNAT superfamily N-acetyltransferase|uniref:GNAT family N-acetyltransferase n=1 Tax=Ensifer canadensis TaxID=555315 RepID=A0AAW4FFK0_9HYPH|nr:MULTISPECIES: GNAT family N-acetyltransferase [Ensifer]AHK42963.1 putative acetyltransferase [Ensifer adhaerens OV14]MDP9628953.1 GNAT superfamily N-acetyltransferase [Ensifer adhaerens]KQU98548.1 acetyltransferase [Ensifer sp. Root31]KQW63308.1 acetyltransferase [Ensifer sp. Root1252]KQW85322.1 acetyltransferase [Ensifer sp. Root127]